MNEVRQLLQLFRVEKQLRGMKHRLTGAEQFLKQQRMQYDDLEQRAGAIRAQLKQIHASIADESGKVEQIEAEVPRLREKMNQARTAMEFNAVVSVLNESMKAKRDIEDRRLASITRGEALENELKEIETLWEERAKIVERAQQDRDERESEIKDRVKELTRQRETLAAEVSPAARALLDDLLLRNGDDAMSPVDVLDRRRGEYSCGSCMMTLPIEAVSSILSGRITQCPSCEAILYSEETLLGGSLFVDLYLPNALPTSDREQIEDLQSAIGAVLTAYGFEPDPKHKAAYAFASFSWKEMFRQARDWVKRDSVQDESKQLYDDLKTGARRYGIDKPGAEAFSLRAESVACMLERLDPFDEVVLRIGDVVLVKGVVGGRTRLVVETISPALERMMNDDPMIAKDPARFFDAIDSTKCHQLPAPCDITAKVGSADVAEETGGPQERPT